MTPFKTLKGQIRVPENALPMQDVALFLLYDNFSEKDFTLFVQFCLQFKVVNFLFASNL
jgi:hypothetical protein